MFSGTASSSGYRESRDERKVRQNGLPLSCSQIVDSSMEEFNDLLTQHTMTEEQISLCRDIRRRGKNKVNLDFLTFHIRMTLSGDRCKNIASSSLHLLILWIVWIYDLRNLHHFVHLINNWLSISLIVHYNCNLLLLIYELIFYAFKPVHRPCLSSSLLWVPKIVIVRCIIYI